jgi:hypothetical protein
VWSNYVQYIVIYKIIFLESKQGPYIYNFNGYIILMFFFHYRMKLCNIFLFARKYFYLEIELLILKRKISCINLFKMYYIYCYTNLITRNYKKVPFKIKKNGKPFNLTGPRKYLFYSSNKTKMWKLLFAIVKFEI